MNWGEQVSGHRLVRFIPNTSEPIPPNILEPHGKCVQLNCFVDATQDGNQITQQPYTGVLLFMCCAPMMSYSKQQNTVRISTFGLELVAFYTATEMTQAP
jgi:hypothetical protein